LRPRIKKCMSYREYVKARPVGPLRNSIHKIISLLLHFVLFWRIRVLLYRLMGMRIIGLPYIGRECFLDPEFPELITIEDGATISSRVIIATHDSSRDLVAPVTIKTKAFVGTGAIILPGVTVGEKSVVGAGSVVTRDVGPGDVVAGNPARFVKKVEGRVKWYREGV